MNNITLGKYTPFNTFIHRLDPRVKIISLIFLMVAIFFSYGSTYTNLIVYAAIFVINYIIMKIAKLSFRQLLKQLKPMVLMMFFIFIVNLFSIKDELPIYWGDNVYYSFTIPLINWTIYYSAIIQTFYIVVRLMLMLSLTMVLTASTKPMDLTYGLEWLMAPLKKIKFPVHEISMTISLALRFIPTLLDETERIMKAQTSRGVDFQDGSLKEKVRAIISLIIPLFISAFQRSDELASAMEARGYDPSKPRTRYRLLKWTKNDTLALIFTLVIFATTLTLSIIKFTII